MFKTDAIPATWEFLNGLRKDDLISELIQNDLDAGASITRIGFGCDRLICEGNGAPVDDNGWERLKYFRGAGCEVACKKQQIGVKNHGLKSCFTIGDEIRILSDGKRTQQTLYDAGRDKAPTPGALRSPVPDSTAPAGGCRIEVPYRTSDLDVGVGQGFHFSAVTADDIAELFRQRRVRNPLIMNLSNNSRINLHCAPRCRRGSGRGVW